MNDCHASSVTLSLDFGVFSLVLRLHLISVDPDRHADRTFWGHTVLFKTSVDTLVFAYYSLYENLFSWKSKFKPLSLQFGENNLTVKKDNLGYVKYLHVTMTSFQRCYIHLHLITISNFWCWCCWVSALCFRWCLEHSKCCPSSNAEFWLLSMHSKWCDVDKQHTAISPPLQTNLGNNPQ